MSRMRISDLQRARIVTEDGERIGHLFDLATRLEQTNRPPRVERLLVGRGGFARRIGISRASAIEIPIEAIVRVDGDDIVVRSSGW